MKTITLGRTGLEVTRVAYGTWQFGGDWGAVDERAAIGAIHRARDLGITFFDTAQAYGFGVSERILGRALADEVKTHRDRLVIATKGGLRMQGETLLRDSSPNWLRAGVEHSLDNLGLDYIDLYQVHWPDPKTPFAETAGALGEMVDEGLIRHIGVSNYSVDQTRAFSSTRPVETVQPAYHLFHREIEGDLLPYAAENDIGVLAYGPLAHGLLGGRFDADTTFPPDDWRSASAMFAGESFQRNLAVVQRLRQVAAGHDATVGQLAVAWTLAHPAVHVAIVGARNPVHLTESVKAADIGLSPSDLDAIDQILADAVPVRGPSPETV